MEPKDPILTRDVMKMHFYVEMMSRYRIFHKRRATVFISQSWDGYELWTKNHWKKKHQQKRVRTLVLSAVIFSILPKTLNMGDQLFN